MSVTSVWKDDRREGEYAVFTFRKDSGISRIKLLGESRNHMKLIEEIYDAGTLFTQSPGPVYLKRENLLEALSASGVKPEEIEKLKSKL